jgi:hypothetical protein
VEGVGFLVYSMVKFGAYVGWSAFGVKLHGHTTRIFLKGLLFGTVRLFMGLVFGLGAIFILANAVIGVSDSSPATYLIVYVPVRWIEWSLLGLMIDPQRASFKSFLGGSSRKSIYWKLGGILISCLADIPMLLTLRGLPVGRFMC